MAAELTELNKATRYPVQGCVIRWLRLLLPPLAGVLGLGLATALGVCEGRHPASGEPVDDGVMLAAGVLAFMSPLIYLML